MTNLVSTYIIGIWGWYNETMELKAIPVRALLALSSIGVAISACASSPQLQPYAGEPTTTGNRPPLVEQIPAADIKTLFMEYAAKVCPITGCNPSSMPLTVSNTSLESGNLAETENGKITIVSTDPRLNAETLSAAAIEELTHSSSPKRPAPEINKPEAYWSEFGLYYSGMSEQEAALNIQTTEAAVNIIGTRLLPNVGFYRNPNSERGASALMKIMTARGLTPQDINNAHKISSPLMIINKLGVYPDLRTQLKAYLAFKLTIYAADLDQPVSMNGVSVKPISPDDALASFAYYEKMLTAR